MVNTHHVLEKVIGCRVERLLLHRNENYRLDPRRLEAQFATGYDLIVLVNPNSPAGQHVPRVELERVLRTAPPSTRIWVDETYVDYAGPGESLESFAARSENVIVCKSMSKTYALSGARVAYLCAGAHQLEIFACPDAALGGQPTGASGGSEALEDTDYYAARYAGNPRAAEELAKKWRRSVGKLAQCDQLPPLQLAAGRTQTPPRSSLAAVNAGCSSATQPQWFAVGSTHNPRGREGRRNQSANAPNSGTSSVPDCC